LDVIRGSTNRLAAIREAVKSRPTSFAIAAVTIIVGFALGFSIYFQSVNEHGIRTALIEEQRIRQTGNMEGLGRQINSDLESILGRLQGIANSNYVQEGKMSGESISALLAENYIPIRDSVSSLSILDANDIETATVVPDDQNYVGLSHSGKDYVIDAKRRLAPVLSTSFTAVNSTSHVVLSYPIIQRESGEYLGLVAALIPLQQILGGIGSPYITETERVLASDKSGTFILADDRNLIGKDFQNKEILQRMDNPADFENLFRRALRDQTSSAVVDGLYERERLLVAYPVSLREEVVFVIVGSTPTEGIYSKIEDIVFTQRIQTSALVAAIFATVAIIVYFLARWSETLQREVKKRTEELESANKKLAAHDSMQAEFINIAAHELRTPVQPLLGVADMLDLSFGEDKKSKIELSRAELDLIRRNANRLVRLSTDLLDVSKIESNSLHLQKEELDLSQRIQEVITDSRGSLRGDKKEKIRILRDQAGSSISERLVINGDKVRIDQVLSNLIGNAIKFTQEGQVTVRCERRDRFAIVSIRDSGSGIDEEIIPRLFTKFATRSESGTGLGLFISKNIIESHGGTIWAENNADGKGATFSFALPIETRYSERSDPDSLVE